MAKLLITTQVHENYGAHDWDGMGECPQYWKAKGGCEYVIRNIQTNTHPSIAESATAMVMAVREQIEQNSEHYRETILDWSVVADDYLTEFERDQLKYEGIIRFGAKEIQL